MPTVRLRNVNPLGEVDVPGVGQLTRGQEFDVDSAIAEVLLEQVGNYELAKASKDGE